VIRTTLLSCHPERRWENNIKTEREIDSEVVNLIGLVQYHVMAVS
jgi:hypothetical protein